MSTVLEASSRRRRLWRAHEAVFLDLIHEQVVEFSCRTRHYRLLHVARSGCGKSNCHRQSQSKDKSKSNHKVQREFTCDTRVDSASSKIRRQPRIYRTCLYCWVSLAVGYPCEPAGVSGFHTPSSTISKLSAIEQPRRHADRRCRRWISMVWILTSALVKIWCSCSSSQ